MGPKDKTADEENQKKHRQGQCLGLSNEIGMREERKHRQTNQKKIADYRSQLRQRKKGRKEGINKSGKMSQRGSLVCRLARCSVLYNG